jgi:lysophospholipase L1-like esterase
MLPFPRTLLLLATLLAAPLFRAAAEAPLIGFAKWEKEVTAIEQRYADTPAPKNAILFIGSSSIKKWTGVAGDFPHHQVLNHGFGGSELGDSAHFADRLVIPFAPRYIVVYAGGNDLNAKKTPEQVFAAFKEFVANVRAKLPETPIAYISIAGNPKRWAQVEEVKRANALIEGFTREQPKLVFIDVFHPMLGADGLPKPEIFGPDLLHMNLEGYKLWTEIVGRYLPAPDKP